MTNAIAVGPTKQFCLLVLAACALSWPGAAGAQENAAGTLIPVTVELGDVSLTKPPFIMAADNGIYERNGLKVSEFTFGRAGGAWGGRDRSAAERQKRRRRDQYRGRQPHHGAHDLGRDRAAPRHPGHHG
jgi:hypothetical protein